MTDDVVQIALRESGSNAEGDSLVAFDSALRADASRASALLERLAPRVPTEAGLARGRALVAKGSALLATKDFAHAHGALSEAVTLLGGDSLANARGWLRLASAELNLGRRSPARQAVIRVLVELLGSGEEALLRELGALLVAMGDTTASMLAELRRESRVSSQGAERFQVLARLLHALNSAASGTSEPLYAILRAILDETQADRGFLMVYDEDTLRFELGLEKSGHRLAPSDFAFSTTIVERALETRRCVVIPDLGIELTGMASESASELGLAAALCAPLRLERRRSGASANALNLPQVKNVAGVLYVDATTKGKFRESDASFFEVLADGAVLALRARAAIKVGESRSVEAESRLAQTGESDEELQKKYPEIVTRDAGMRALLGLVDRAAASDVGVLVRGESGTGKELIARALHRRGLRARGPFEVLDCATLQAELAASDLFGHEKSAFTGATAAREGAFERASGGTLFLDQIGEMPLPLQGSLLRVLQEGEVRRLGSDRVRRVDVRVVCATHRDLKALVERGEFRHDLLFRLAVVELKLPPLRARRGDIPLLARHFLAKKDLAIETEALVRLEEHPWPGNVRELENVLAAASLKCPSLITRAAIDDLLGDRSGNPEVARAGTIEEIEKRAIEERLELCFWNQAAAAKSLGIDRNTLRRKIVRYGVVRRSGPLTSP